MTPEARSLLWDPGIWIAGEGNSRFLQSLPLQYVLRVFGTLT